MEALNNDKIAVVYGTNLGMLMDAMFKRESGISAHQVAEEAATVGKEAVGVFKKPADDDDVF